MRAVHVLMSLVNVGLAALSGFFVMRAPYVFHTGGEGKAVPETLVPFALVAAFPVFCLIAAVVPLVLSGRGQVWGPVMIAVFPALIAAAVYAVIMV